MCLDSWHVLIYVVLPQLFEHFHFGCWSVFTWLLWQCRLKFRFWVGSFPLFWLFDRSIDAAVAGWFITLLLSWLWTTFRTPIFALLRHSSFFADCCLESATQKIFVLLILQKWDPQVTKFESFHWFQLLLDQDRLLNVFRYILSVVVCFILVILCFCELIAEPLSYFGNFCLLDLVVFDLCIIEQCYVSWFCRLVVSGYLVLDFIE